MQRRYQDADLKRIKWVRPHPEHHPVRVHYLDPQSSWTLCKALATENTPYLHVPGHAVVSTNAEITCLRCMALVVDEERSLFEERLAQCGSCCERVHFRSPAHGATIASYSGRMSAEVSR
jgi:hypothetical protein